MSTQEEQEQFAVKAPGENLYLYHWRFDRGEEFGLYRHAEDADARAAEHAGEGLSEVLSMVVIDRPQPAPELADLRERLARAEGDRNAARNVVAEMHAHWQRDGATPEQEELFPQWLAAAGLMDGATAEPQPAPEPAAPGAGAVPRLEGDNIVMNWHDKRP